MQIVFWTWLISASLTLGLFVTVSWIFDRMVVFSTWVKLALAVLVLAGPVGAVLAVILLFKTSLATLQESARQGHPPGAPETGQSLHDPDHFLIRKLSWP